MVNKLKEKLDIGNCLHVNKSKALHCIREEKKNIFGEVDGFTAKHSLCCHFLTGHSRWNVFRSRLELFYASICLTVWQKAFEMERSILEKKVQGDCTNFLSRWTCQIIIFFFLQYVSLCWSYVDSFRSFAAVTSWFRDCKEAAWFLGTSWKNLNCCSRVWCICADPKTAFLTVNKENEILRNPISSKSPKHSDQNTQAAITHSLTRPSLISNMDLMRLWICIHTYKQLSLYLKEDPTSNQTCPPKLDLHPKIK